MQSFLKAPHHAPCQSDYYGHDSTEYAHRCWLADIIDRRNQAIDMMSSWRNTRRRITRKRKFSTCSPTLIYETVTNPPSVTPTELAMAGGASDSAIRQKLTKKANQAGVQHANDLLQLIWGDNSAELRQLWGTPSQIRAKLLVMAKNSDHVLDPGKFFPADTVFDNDPWGKFVGNKPTDPLATSSSTSSSKGTSKGQHDPSIQIAKFEQQVLLSELVTSSGTVLARLHVAELGAHSTGYMLCHSSNLASMLENAQVSAGPIAILTHRAAMVSGHTPSAQVQVVVQVGETKKVLHLAVYLRGLDTIE
eukprot:5770176-Amphidinium_carterae.1